MSMFPRQVGIKEKATCMTLKLILNSAVHDIWYRDRVEEVASYRSTKEQTALRRKQNETVYISMAKARMNL